MPRRRREYDPEGLDDEWHSYDGNLPTSRVSSRRRHGRSIHSRNFHSMLASAVLNDADKHPLFRARDGEKTIRLRTLQHMVVCHLRRELAGQVKTICDTNSAEDMESIRKTMKHYVCALRDLGYMLKNQGQNNKTSRFLSDQLYISTPNDLAILIDAGFSRPHHRPAELKVPRYTGYGGKKKEAKEFFGRLRMALFGGCSLVTPMLIMNLHSTPLTKLITTSVFVFFVGVILAWYMKDARQKDILAVTAAYAAVLVVFVGG